jgi:hypothetical protein
LFWVTARAIVIVQHWPSRLTFGWGDALLLSTPFCSHKHRTGHAGDVVAVAGGDDGGGGGGGKLFSISGAL